MGGRGARMGSVAKGLLPTRDGRSILQRTFELVRPAGDTLVLLGEHAETSAWARARGLVVLADAVDAQGPLAGLLALLQYAREANVLLLAGDMPYLEPALLQRLWSAPPAAIVAPREAGRWQPLCARYAVAEVLPQARAQAATGRFAMQSLLARVAPLELTLDDHERTQLRDWDTPADLD